MKKDGLKFSPQSCPPARWATLLLLLLTLLGAASARAGAPLPAEDAVTTAVIVDAPAVSGRFPSGGSAWFRFNVASAGSYRIDLTPLYSGWDLVVDLYGPDRIDQSVNQFWAGFRAAKSQFAVALSPGTYYLNAWTMKNLNYSGDFSLAISALGPTDGTPVIQRFAINDGAVHASDRRLKLNNACSITPAEYWASPFPRFEQDKVYSGAELQGKQKWHTYPKSKTPSFNGRGNGTERLYFKVRTADGFYSQTASDKIEIITIVPLQENASWADGKYDIPGEWDWWSFKVVSERYYQILATRSQKLELFGPNSRTRRQAAADARELLPGHYSSLIAKLKPGTYYVKVQSPGPYYSQYQIRLAKSMGPIVANVTLKNVRSPHELLDNLTFDRTILFSNLALGGAVQYKVTGRKKADGASPDFTHARWMPYAPEINLTLPSGQGDRSIFFKVRNSKGRESPVVRRDIFLAQAVPLPLGQKRQGQDEQDRRYNPYSFEATQAGEYLFELWNESLNAPLTTHIDFTLYGSDTRAVTAKAVEFAPRDGSSRLFGVKLNPGRYNFSLNVAYFNANGEETGRWYGGKYAVRVSRYAGAPLILDFDASSAFPNTDEDYFTIPETFRREVALNTFAFGAPVSLMASEDSSFTSAAWRPYAAASTFTLSPGKGTKTIYHKSRDAQGRESNAVSARIFYNEPLTLALNGAPQSYYRYDTFKYHQFDVPRKGDYTVDLQPVPGEKSPQSMQAKLLTFDGVKITDLQCYGQTRLELSPGTYLVQTDKASYDAEMDEWHDTGSYTVRVFESQ